MLNFLAEMSLVSRLSRIFVAKILTNVSSTKYKCLKIW